jgi:hypothetical protein
MWAPQRYGCQQIEFGSFIDHEAQAPMQLWNPGVFALDCDFGEHLGVADL